ncbi:MAG: MFS transporter [Myxococcales bacterium]|nr:MFS transporter [Myxococcales bacterium]
MSDARPEGLFSPLKIRNFRLLWSGFIASQIGDMVQILAQSWLVVSLTQSATRVAAVAFAQALPRLAIGLLAGVLVDRFDRRRLLLVTQSLAALQCATFLGLVLSGLIRYELVLALAFALGVLDAMSLTARQALMPTLVPRPMIARAVALQALGVNITQLAGPSLGGVLIGSFGVRGCLAANLVTFVVLIGNVLAMRLPPAEAAPPQSLRRALGEGLGYVRAQPALWVPIALAYALGALGMPVVRLLPLWARVVLSTSGRGYGFLAVASGIGALGASVWVTSRARPRELPRNIAAAGALFSVGVMAFSQTRQFASSFAVLVLVGGAQMAFRSAVMTMVQMVAPDRLRGRIISALAMDFALWSVGAVVLGVAVDGLARRHAGLGAGVLSEAIPQGARAEGLHQGLFIAGAGCLVVTLGALKRLRSTRDALEREGSGP